MSVIWVLLPGILQICSYTTAISNQPELVHTHQESNVTEVKALLDYDAGLIFYNDNSVSACLVEKIPNNILESLENQSAPTFTFPLPSDELCIGRENEFEVDQKLISEAGLLFCNGLPIVDIRKVRTSDLAKPHKLNRRKRQSNSYRTSGHYGGAQAQSNYNQPGQASQAQVQGQVFGSGFFSGQAQSQNGGLSQSQVQLAGVGIRGQIASSSGNAQSQLSLGTGTGSGQASGLGDGPSNSQVQVSLGQQGEETMASASATSGGASAGFGPYYTGHGEYGLRGGGLPPGFIPGTRLFGESVSPPDGTSGRITQGGAPGQYFEQGGGFRNGYTGNGHALTPDPPLHQTNGGHPFGNGGYRQPAGYRNGEAGQGALGPGPLQGSGRYGQGSIGMAGFPQTSNAGGVGAGYTNLQNGRGTGVSNPYTTESGSGNGFGSAGSFPGTHGANPNADQLYGGLHQTRQSNDRSYGSPGALTTRNGASGSSHLSPMSTGQIVGGNGQHVNPTYVGSGGGTSGDSRQTHRVGRYDGTSGYSTVGGRPYAQSVTPGAQATTYGVGQAQAQTVYFGSNGAGQYYPVRYDQSSQPGSPLQNQYVAPNLAGQSQQLPSGSLRGIGASGSPVGGQNGYRTNGVDASGIGHGQLPTGSVSVPSRTQGSRGLSGTGSSSYPGISGYPGSASLPGTSGYPGSASLPATSGYPGSASLPGTSGYPGSASLPGTSGYPGSASLPGTSGYPGSASLPGTSGYPGSASLPATSGYPGTASLPGTSGYPASPGLPGASGFPGSSSLPGTFGYPGSAGLPGTGGFPGTPGFPATVSLPGTSGFPLTSSHSGTSRFPSGMTPGTHVLPGFQGVTGYGTGHTTTAERGSPAVTRTLPSESTRGIPGSSAQDGFFPSYGTAIPSVDDPDGRKCTIVTFSCTIVVESNGRAKICRPNAVQMDRNGNAAGGNGGQGSRICCC